MGTTRLVSNGWAGKRAQSCLLQEQSVGGAFPRGGVNACIGHFVAPAADLGAYVLDAVKRAAIEKRRAEVFDRALDVTFGLRVAHGCGDGLEEQVAREGEKSRIELHGRAHVVQYDALEIVVDHLARACQKFRVTGR